MKFMLLCLTCWCALNTYPALALTPEEKGLEIASKMDKVNSGFIGEIAEMTMTLIDAYGTEIVRKMEGKIKEVNDDGDKSIITFLQPSDVKGTKMLTWSHKAENDDQWLYLPSMKRVKRISSNSKTSSFMGSEFSYEDLGGQSVEKFTYKHLRDEKSDIGNVWVVERYPVNVKESGYLKQVMWIPEKYHASTKVEYYDRKGTLVKTADFLDYQSFQVAGKNIFRPGKIHMKNVQTKKQSIFSWDKRKLGENLLNNHFAQDSLK